ncbi:MAG: 23S rRNA (adenine(2030)-N(6))-methyltransferase RlmJ [Alphaproteobacteria bacterium]|nr:23S rRNA (adenine(2030)-N(6))-methyltransferase RlmJ [Alphaproteobacteria bacterium]
MNYRHAFHAGNFADVVKHAVLTLLVRLLQKKETPVALIDSHAGIGRYDLWTAAPNKTDEYKDGIGRLWGLSAPPEDLAPYLSIVSAMNGEHLRHYPGSPYLLRQLMRPQDRLILAEKHPEDAQALKALFHADRQVAVHDMDGWHALKAFLPPSEKRGLALIDPPFEERGEYERLGNALIKTHRRWPQGVLMGWHPIKEMEAVEGLYEMLRQSQIPGILAVRHLLGGSFDPNNLNGSGLILLNPPYTSEERLARMLPFLAEILAKGAGAEAQLDWIAKDV